MSDDATIFAPASGTTRAAIAIVRVCGARAADALRALAGTELPHPRVATRARLHDPKTQEMLDDALVLWFPAGRSFTGEDTVEFHLHGGRAINAGVLAALADLPGMRLAEPGEFTRRAFIAGKFDLTQVEAIADLVAAETSAQRIQALRQMEGALGRLYDGWRAGIIRNLALVEADLEFPEEDIPTGITEVVKSNIYNMTNEMSRHLGDYRRGEIIRDGMFIALVGAPNSGKSTLLNYLAGRDAAIVSAIAGTTRDVLEVQVDLSGFKVIFADTAGLRDARDVIEQEGVRRAEKAATEADLCLVVMDGAAPEPADGRVLALASLDKSMILLNKIDMPEAREKIAQLRTVYPNRVWPISVRSTEGMAEFVAGLEKSVRLRLRAAEETPILSRIRHREALESCLEHLRRFQTHGEDVTSTELAAEDMRMAAREIGRITGRIDVEQILDVVFREFCIGK